MPDKSISRTRSEDSHQYFPHLAHVARANYFPYSLFFHFLNRRWTGAV
jgi:hypothetical protein